MSKYDIDYFIAKVEALKEEDFTIGEMSTFKNKDCCCMVGHCTNNGSKWVHTKESVALTKLFEPENKKEVGDDISLYNIVIKKNDNMIKGHIKKSWIQILNSIKNGN